MLKWPAFSPNSMPTMRQSEKWEKLKNYFYSFHLLRIKCVVDVPIRVVVVAAIVEVAVISAAQIIITIVVTTLPAAATIAHRIIATTIETLGIIAIMETLADLVGAVIDLDLNIDHHPIDFHAKTTIDRIVGYLFSSQFKLLEFEN